MPGPLDALRLIHHAIRADIQGIEDGTRAGNDGLDARLSTLRRMMHIHEAAEENVLFPVIDEVVPGAATPYVLDHRGVESLLDTLEAALGNGDGAAAAASAVRGALNLHLDKEEQHLLDELCHPNLDLPTQGKLVGEFAAQTPPADFGDFVTWLMPLLGRPQQIQMMGAWKKGMPPEVFEKTCGIAEAAIGAEAMGEVVAAL